MNPPFNTCPVCGALTGWRQVRFGTQNLALRWRHRNKKLHIVGLGRKAPWCSAGRATPLTVPEEWVAQLGRYSTIEDPDFVMPDITADSDEEPP